MKKVGIDIGGTQMRCGIFDENGEMINVLKTNNNKEIGAEKNMDRLLDFITSFPYSYSGIGIGFPGPLNMRLGKVLNPPNLVGWQNFEIVKYVEEKTGIKTILNSDANVAGLAEAVLGAGQGYESVYYLTLSTGIGAGYIVDGKIINGAYSAAAEVYNMIVNDDQHTHNGVNKGAVNEQSSGTGLEMIGAEAYGRPIKPKELFELYYAGDEKAIPIIENAVDVLARCVANICCVVDPEVFVVGGSIALYQPAYVEMVYEKAKEYAINPQFLFFVPAKYGDDAGMIGASLLV